MFRECVRNKRTCPMKKQKTWRLVEYAWIPFTLAGIGCELAVTYDQSYECFSDSDCREDFVVCSLNRCNCSMDTYRCDPNFEWPTDSRRIAALVLFIISFGVLIATNTLPNTKGYPTSIKVRALDRDRNKILTSFILAASLMITSFVFASISVWRVSTTDCSMDESCLVFVLITIVSFILGLGSWCVLANSN